MSGLSSQNVPIALCVDLDPLEVAVYSDPGRTVSETEWLIPESARPEGDGRLVALIDGYSGFADGGGDIAASYVRDSLLSVGRRNASSAQIVEGARAALAFANSKVSSTNRRLRKARGESLSVMWGCASLTAAWIYPGTAVVAQAGRTSAVQVVEGQITRLTRDDSLLGERIRRGEHVPPDQIQMARNIVMRGVGVSAELDAEVQQHSLCDRYRLVLSTRDLTESHRPDMELQRILVSHLSSVDLARNLVDRVRALDNDVGGITVIIVERRSE